MIKRSFIAAIFILIKTSSSAQNWGGGVDEETLHFGFGFHYISSEYKVFKKAGWRDPFRDPETGEIVRDSLYSISSPGATGFGLGFVSDLKLSDHINLRFTPALAFADRFLNYEYVKGTVIEDVNSTGAEAGPFLQKKVTATMVDMPIGIKLKSDRRMNYRVYLIGGIKYSMDIISKKKTDDSGFTFAEKLIKNKSHFLSYEAGIGFDFYFEFFKLSPELKLSNSFNNVLEPEDHPYSKPIDKLLLRNLQFSLYFE